jgi:hypothetical protein
MGFRPRRAIPRTMCLTLASGCSEVTRMVRSVCARTRGQSVLEGFEEDDFFISRGLSKRNDVNTRAGLCVHDGNRYASQKAERHEPLFAVSKAIIFKCKRWPFKYSRCIDEIETVFFKVSPTFRFIPSKTHIITVYTLRQCVNWCRIRAMTLLLTGLPKAGPVE